MHLLGIKVLMELVCKDDLKSIYLLLHNKSTQMWCPRTIAYYFSWLYLVGWA